jgi:hypothetical protein
MNIPLISHEIPKTLFPYHDFISDYPYVLAHLLLEGTNHYDEEYTKFYEEKLKSAKYSILDNSLYELGDSIDYKLLYELGEKYKPTHLILPDKLHDREITMDRTMRYLVDFRKNSSPSFIGVIQGRNLNELFQMYYFYCSIPEIKIIALPLYILPETNIDFEDNKPLYEYEAQFLTNTNPCYHSQSLYSFSKRIENDITPPIQCYELFRVGIVKELMIEFDNQLPKPIHLLGCLTPLEYLQYSKLDKANIFSIDSSTPIVYGWNGIKIHKEMKEKKPNDKIAENLNKSISQEQLALIAKNVLTIRHFLYSSKN